MNLQSTTLLIDATNETIKGEGDKVFKTCWTRLEDSKLKREHDRWIEAEDKGSSTR